MSPSTLGIRGLLRRYLGAMAPLIATISFIVAAVILYQTFILCSWFAAGCSSVNLQPILSSYPHASDSALRDLASNYAGRLNWTYLTGLSIAACFGGIAIGAQTILKSLCNYPLFTRLKALAALLSLASLTTIILLLFWNYDANVAAILRATAQAEFKNVVGLRRSLDGLSFFTAMFLVGASCMILWPPKVNKFDAEYLADRKAKLRLILYTGTAILIFGVLEINSLMQWSSSFLHPPDADVRALNNLISSLVTLRGTYYTIFLAAIYLPAALILRMRAFGLACDIVPPQSGVSREEWLKSKGLSFSILEQLPHFAAILGPMLSGPAAELLSRLR